MADLLCLQVCLFLGRSKSTLHLKLHLFFLFVCLFLSDYLSFHLKLFLRPPWEFYDWERGPRRKAYVDIGKYYHSAFVDIGEMAM